LVDLHGWSEGIYNHITCRVPGSHDHFLINPFGFLFHEVTASSLIKVDVDGTIVDPGSSNYGINNRGYTLHSAVHMNRPDVECVIHLHLPEVIAVSATKNGFLPISQEALFVGPVADYGFKGILDDLNERSSIVDALGKNNAMLLRNHGFVICGDTIEQAFLRTFFFLYHMKVQAHLTNTPKEELILPDEKASYKTYHVLLQGEISGVENENGKIPMHWPQGQLDWEAQMRLLDNLGMKTGHKYRLPLWRK
jgi:adducin